MAGLSRVIMSVFTVYLSTCKAFTFPSAARCRWSATNTNSMQRTAATTNEHHRPPTFYRVGAAWRPQQSNKIAQPNNDKQLGAIVITSIATFAGSAGPAYADNVAEVAEGFAQGVGGLNGPGLLAIPIVFGFLVATAVAVFIYSFSQPREYDE